MVFYKRRHGADLHRVSIICRVLKESVVRVEQLLRQKEEELSRRTTVVQAAKEAQVQEAHFVSGSGRTVSYPDSSRFFQSRAGESSLCSLQWISVEVLIYGSQ